MSASDFGFKVSLPGYDVASATPEQCAVHSSYPPIKSKTNQTNPHFALLSVDFTATVTQGITHTLYAINHGYGYIPFTISSIVFYDGSQSFHGIGFAGNASTLVIDAYCTTTQFIVQIYDDFNWTNSSATLEVSYFIAAENGT